MILKQQKSVSLPATKAFKVKDYFKKPFVSYFYDDQYWQQFQAIVEAPIKETTATLNTLNKGASWSTIRQEATPVTAAQLYWFLKIADKNGYYLAEIKGSGLCFDCRWDDDGWYCYLFPVSDDVVWDADDRVLSGDSSPVKLSPADSQTLEPSVPRDKKGRFTKEVEVLETVQYATKIKFQDRIYRLDNE